MRPTLPFDVGRWFPASLLSSSQTDERDLADVSLDHLCHCKAVDVTLHYIHFQSLRVFRY